jgi:hypothetical protein
MPQPNTAENYFSILKRGIYGVYQHVSEAHLRRYLAEFDFRYNNRSGLGLKMENVRRALSKASPASASRTGWLTKPRTKKQKARRFLRWKRARDSSKNAQ